jgi:hypothetical protein
LFGAKFARQRVEVEIADSPKQDCVRRARNRQRCGWQRMAMLAISDAADVSFDKRQAKLERIKHAHGFACDFGTDPVTRQESDRCHRGRR